jgi:hypothetical protein
MRKDKIMDEKDKNKIVELKEKADRKKDIYIRGLPGDIGERKLTVNAINRAFAEDEMIRQNAERTATIYLGKVDKEIEAFPKWGFFVFGMLFVIIIEVYALHTPMVDYFMKFFGTG